MSTYGTTSGSARIDNTTGHHPTEEDGLLPRKDRRSQPISRRIYDHLNVDVDSNHGDLVLLLCYVITGLLDSCATAAWGSFVSMQTGNTIYFGLGLSNLGGSTKWVKSGTSIVLFCFGSFCFARFNRYFSPKRRWVLMMSFTIQFLMIVIAAAITMLGPKVNGSEHDLHWHLLVPLALIAFQSSGQAVTSRVLDQSGLTSVVLTSIYCDLFSDAKLFSWPSENVSRNRRAAAPILLLVGALCGGLWSNSEIGMAGALWTAAILKASIIVAWILWPPGPASEDDAR